MVEVVDAGDRDWYDHAGSMMDAFEGVRARW
jgi:hypothetical protein